MIINNLPFLLTLISLSAVATIIADVLGKQWVVTYKISYFILAIILIIISGFFFILSLKYEKLGIVSVVWDGVTSIVLIAIGYFFFKETLTFIQLLGIGFIFLGMFLLFIKL